MFTEEQRRDLRDKLIERAQRDDRIVGAALTGSAARDAEDLWSDIDLFFGVRNGVPVAEVLADWSDFLHAEVGVLHHFDLRAGTATYRAFLLRGVLEVDLGFTPVGSFGPLGDGAFRVLFGQPVPRKPNAVDTDHLTGRCWHHVLHARVCIERGAMWQAEYWISALRDHTLTLACHRLGLSIDYLKGADHLTDEATKLAEQALVRELEPGELLRALRAATQALLDELRQSAPSLADVLQEPLIELAGS